MNAKKILALMLCAMLKEMATAGVGMAVVVTAVWVGMVAIASGVEKKAAKEAEVKGLER